MAFLESNDRSTAIGLVTTDDVRGFIVGRRDAGLAGNSVASDFGLSGRSTAGPSTNN